MCPRIPLSSLILLCLCSLSSAAEPKLDRYGDPLPEGASARLGSLSLRPEGAIQNAAFTADGKTLVVCETLSVSFWDPATGKCVRRMPLDRSVPIGIKCISDNAKVLMVGDFKNVLHFVDPASGAEQGTLNHAQCGSLWGWPYLSRDGKILAAIHRSATAIDKTSIAVWDVKGGKLLHEFKEPALAQVAPQGVIALTPDGKQLIRPHADGSLHLVDVASGKDVLAFEMPPSLPAPRGSFRFSRLALSPDGRYLAFGGPVPWTVCEVATGKRLHQLGPGHSPLHALAFTPNGRFLAVDSPYNEIRLIGVVSGKEIRKLPKNKPAHSQMMVFSPDGRTLADFSGSSTIRLWDVVAERRLHPPIGHETGVRALAFFPDDKRLVSDDQTGEMKVWDIVAGQPGAQRTYSSGSSSLTVDKDGETIRYAGFDSSAHQWNVRTGREEASPKVIEGLSTNRVILSPDGRSLALVDLRIGAQQKAPRTPELRLYDLKTNKPIDLQGAPVPAVAAQLVFTPDSRYLAGSCSDGALRLWDRATGKLVREFKPEGPMRQVSNQAPVFAADGRSLVLVDRALHIREIASGEDRLQIPSVSNSFSLAYSPDARFVACGQADGQLVVYSAVSGKKLAGWQGKQGYIQALAFSHDNRFLASGGSNGTILIWKVSQDDPVPIALKPDEADSFWQALGDSDASAANHALARLTATPAQSVPLFRERLSSIAKQLENKQFAELIADLDSDSFKVREKATRELALAGESAAEALRHAMNQSPSAETKRRLEDLLSRLKKGGDSQRLRFLRAVEALERIGTPEAKEALRNLAGQSLPVDLREEVQASLSRLEDNRP